MLFQERKLKKAFQRVKEDVWHFKLNMDDWIRFLNGNQYSIFHRLDRIEDKLEKLNDKLEKVIVK